jgi:hypothetical protein
MKSLLALALGLAAALLVAACGSSAGLIPGGDSGPLNKDFDQIQAAVQSNDCTGVHHWLNTAEKDLANLPTSVDSTLRDRLQTGIQQLSSDAYAECQGAASASTTAASTTASTTPATTATTTPTTTSTSTTTSTDTTPTTAPTTSTTTTPPTTTTGATTTGTSTQSTPSGGVGAPPSSGQGNGNGNAGGASG